jgi:hypothetical protein
MTSTFGVASPAWISIRAWMKVPLPRSIAPASKSWSRTPLKWMET